MITGIQKTLNIISDDQNHVVSDYDFKFHNIIQVECPYSNSFNRCKFKDNFPYVFQSIRRAWGIENQNFVDSIGTKTFQTAFFDNLKLMLSENSTGKSGSFFFKTSDQRYMIKTIRKEEYKTLKGMISDYHQFITDNNNSLINRYFGLYQIKCYQNKDQVIEIYVTIINNILRLTPSQQLLSLYDLKGSTFGRSTDEKQIAEGIPKKDVNAIEEKLKVPLRR